MTDNSTRKGTRQKKIPKYLQYEDIDYGTVISAKLIDSKEKIPNNHEIISLAKLLGKFVQNINQKSKEWMLAAQSENNFNDNSLVEISKRKGSLLKEGQTQQKTKQILGNAISNRKGNKDIQENTKGQRRKKIQNQQKSSSLIQSDTNYHTLINKHIKMAFPNLGQISPQMLSRLNLPQQLLINDQQLKNKSQKDKQQRQKEILLSNIKNAKIVNQEIKPFKRQSYHIAIAYHIHLHKSKNNPVKTGQEIDPTYNAKRLRQQTEKDDSTKLQKQKNDQKNQKNKQC